MCISLHFVMKLFRWSTRDTSTTDFITPSSAFIGTIPLFSCTKKGPCETSLRWASFMHLMCVNLLSAPLQFPTIKIGLSCCRSFKSHPVHTSNASPRVRPSLRTAHTFPGSNDTPATRIGECAPNCNGSFLTAGLSLQSLKTVLSSPSNYMSVFGMVFCLFERS